MNPTYLWLIAAILLALLELLTPGFILACFSIGALLAIVPALLGWALLWQVLFFAAGSFLALFLLRPFMRRFANWDKSSRTGVDALPGRRATVVEAIEGHRLRGRIAIDGDQWPAFAEDPEQRFAVGESVYITRNESIVMYVAHSPGNHEFLATNR